MPAGAGLLGPVGLGHAEGVAQGGYAGLQVELGRLCQVSLLAKVVKAEERGATLHLGLHHGGRGDLWWQRKGSQGPKPHVDFIKGGSATRRVVCSAQLALRHLVVSAAEEVVPEALRDGGAGPQDLGHVLSSDQHVAVVQLDVHVRLFVQQVVGAARWRQANQLPEVAVQLVATGCLCGAKRKSEQLV